MTSAIRHDWRAEEIAQLYEQPFFDLLYQAQTVHRRYFDPNAIQLGALLNIKTGACPEDCAYCSQSGHYQTGLKKEKLWSLEDVVERAKTAKAQGATRFCMGAAWRSPPKAALPQVLEIIKAVKALGLETCVTLGMLTDQDAEQLKEAGVDFYNHNLDSSPEFYEKIITTRTYQQRLDTLEKVRQAGMKVCCGGIVGLGESREDRIGLLLQLANLPEHPLSVPINHLMPVAGTPLADAPPLDSFEFIRTIAVARILMPKSYVRLSAGRSNMNDEMQALCLFAGANSMWLGDKLLSVPNPSLEHDETLLPRLGLKPLSQPPEWNAVAENGAAAAA